MNSSPTIQAISAAFVAAQAEIPHAPKQSTNPHFKSSYADLATVTETIRPVLAKHGLAVLQSSTPADGGVRLQTILLHKSGEWIADEGLFAPLQKHDAQGVGSATTYVRRYGLCALLGVAQDDDDGNAASTPPQAKQTKAASGQHLWPFGEKKGTPLQDMPTKDLEWFTTKYEVKPGQYEAQGREMQAAAAKILKERNQ